MTPSTNGVSVSVGNSLADLVDQLTARLQAGEDIDSAEIVAAHPEHADRLSGLLPALRAAAALANSGDDPLPNAELGDFRIVRQVGRGGMGVVYEAEQLSLRRRVALKVLPFAATMDPKQLQRFRNEALAAASLHHEHIVPVHAVGCERGVHYYAMQFIEGHTLADMICVRTVGKPKEKVENATAEFRPPSPGFAGEGLGVRAAVKVSKEPSPPTPLPQSRERGEKDTAPVAALSTRTDLAAGRAAFRQAAEWIAQAAEALEFAHSLGVIHRDVKPGNLMVDAAGKLWVADFGLARFGPDAGLTMSGALLGTLRYMAPEQAMARHGLADHRVDVYGLGCTLYELLTGKPAVRGEDKADILRHIAFEEPIAPRKFDKAIPAELETIALKCLAKNPNERYATAGELAADLRRFLENKPIKAKPPTLRQRAVKCVGRHMPLAVSAAVTLTITLVAVAGSAGYVFRDRTARLAMATQSAESALAGARAAIEAGDLAAAGRQLAEARGHIGADRDQLSLVAGEIEGVQERINICNADSERFRKFIAQADEAQMNMGYSKNHGSGKGMAEGTLRMYGVLDIADWRERLNASTLTADQKRQVLETAYLTLVSLADYEVRWVKDPEAAEHCLNLLQRAEEFHAPTRAFFFVRKTCHDQQKNATAAAEDFKLFKAAVAQSPWDYYLPGHSAGWWGDLPEAIRSYRAALNLQPNHFNSLFFLAVRLGSVEVHRYPEAIQLYTACLALRPRYRICLRNRALLNAKIGEWDDAAADYTAYLALPTTDNDKTLAYAFRCLAYAKTGRTKEAREDLQQVILFGERELASRPVTLGRGDVEPVRDVALAYLLADRIPEALALFERLVACQKKLLGPDRVEEEDISNLVTCYLKARRFDDAIVLRKECLERRLATLEPDDPKTLDAMTDLCNAYTKADRLDDTTLLAEQLLSGIRKRYGADDARALACATTLAASYIGANRFKDAVARLGGVIDVDPDNSEALNSLAWIYATCPDPMFRNPASAVQLASRVIKRAPKNGSYWNTLGVAQYRVGNWKEATAALKRSMDLRQGGDGVDWCFMAMAYWQLDDKQQARTWYDKAAGWRAGTKAGDAELRRFLVEATELLGVRAKRDP